MHRNKWKWKHSNPKPMEHCQCSARGRFIAIQAYLNKQEKSQINNLKPHLKHLQREEMKNPRVVEEKKS